jgi:hemoglobin-like flavoprotein
MTVHADIISQTLALVADRCGDPAALVYARLFAENPDMEALFIRDTSGLVRGQMLAVVLESLLDYVTDRSYGANLIQIERVNHEGLGVPPDVFDTFFSTVAATCKDILGPEWTREMDAAWSGLLDELPGREARPAAPSHSG